MAFVAAPALRIKSIKWGLNRPSQVNVGAYTGVRQVVATPWYSQWSASVELAPMIGEASALKLRSFFGRVQGSLNAFRVYATENAQNANFGVTVASTASAGSNQVSIAGYTTPLTEGQLLTINGQLLCCSADQSGSTVSFHPRLRQQATAGTPVVTSRPYALVYMNSDQLGWSVDPGQLYGASFDVSEAILETDGVTVPETPLVSNGAFGTDTSGWSAGGSTLSVVAGRMRVTNTGAGQGTGTYTIAGLIPGKAYRLQGDLFGGTSQAGLYMSQQTNGVGTGLVIQQQCAVSPATGHVDVTFTPPNGSPYYIVCYALTGGAGAYADFDNISLSEA